jgi:PPOX class probable F420-dependent enzyme
LKRLERLKPLERLERLQRSERLKRIELSRGARHLLRSARLAHLATADAQGQPHVVPICFVFDGKTFYSPIDAKPKRLAPRKLKRLRNIRENPQVSLVIDHYQENWTRLAYVLIFGKARLLASGKKHQDAVRLLRIKYGQYRSMDLGHRPIIAIRPLRITYWSGSRQSG